MTFARGSNKNKSEHQYLLEWLGDYNLEKFDIDEVNKAILNPDKYLFDFRDL